MINNFSKEYIFIQGYIIYDTKIYCHHKLKSLAPTLTTINLSQQLERTNIFIYY